ncbi:hypothetical protein [Burkholderia sp. Leaf177]|uniref:hypothetical protein n=1 Tax=Burkholderia sp. Leaf177 TaxID=1736287 RepID=UPI000A64349F|nr:hypothetical protein [Burkholderia sp. Leaf177]
MIDLSEDHLNIIEARIDAYSVHHDHPNGAQHVFEFVLKDASGIDKIGSVSVHAARQLRRHRNLGLALSRMLHAIGSTPPHELSTLVEMRFAGEN